MRRTTAVWLLLVLAGAAFAGLPDPRFDIRPADPIQRLVASAERFGERPDACIKNHIYRFERTIFRDTVTGSLIWRVTNDRTSESHVVTQSPWNADGSLMYFLSSRPAEGARGRLWLIDGDGTRVRSWAPFRSRETYVAWPNWHPEDPYVMYGWRSAMKEISALDARTGKMRTIAAFPDLSDQAARTEVRFLGFDKAGKRLLLFDRNWSPTGWSIALDGSDRRRFDEGDLWGVRRKYWKNLTHGHGDQNPSRTMFAKARGDVGGPIFENPRRLTDVRRGNHVAWDVTDDWFVVGSNPGYGRPEPLSNQILKVFTLGPDYFHRICSANTVVGAYYQCAFPQTSPDGTKVAWTSSMLGSIDLYLAQMSLPAAPLNLTASRTADGVRLAWQAPVFSREIAGYYVYRSAQSGRGFAPLTPEPVRDTGFTDTASRSGQTAVYRVAAVEHSGIEGLPSLEAAVDWPPEVRCYVEAEGGDLALPMQLSRDMECSAWHYAAVWSEGEEAGSVRIPFSVPHRDKYAIQARTKGATDGVAVELDGRRLAPWMPRARDWAWQRVADAQLTAGAHVLHLSWSGGLLGLDRILLTNEPDFEPEGIGGTDIDPPERIKKPVKVAAERFHTHIAWEPSDAADLWHYNVYAARGRDVPPGPETLVGSPSTAEYVDWGLAPNSRYVYRVTAVDRAGNEGAASDPLAVTTGGLKVERISLEAESAGFGPPLAAARDERASEGRWVVASGEVKDADHALRFPLDVAVGGEYLLWARFFTLAPPSNVYLAVQVDEAHAASWYITFDNLFAKNRIRFVDEQGTTEDFESWTCARTLQGPDGPGYRLSRLSLTPGGHTLAVAGLPPGLAVDRIVLSNDFSWRPDGRLNRN